MLSKAIKEARLREYAKLCEFFKQKMGLTPLCKVDDWVREALIKYPIVNHRVQGDLLKRVSTATKIKALKFILEKHGHKLEAAQQQEES